MKLSKTQEKLLSEIKNDVELAKSCKNPDEYMEKMFDKSTCFNQAYTIEDYKRDYREIKTWTWEIAQNNKTWGFYNSITLRALERKGLIKIEVDGKNDKDIIELL